jgi:hypothetical protein
MHHDLTADLDGMRRFMAHRDRLLDDMSIEVADAAIARGPAT